MKNLLTTYYTDPLHAGNDGIPHFDQLSPYKTIYFKSREVYIVFSPYVHMGVVFTGKAI